MFKPRAACIEVKYITLHCGNYGILLQQFFRQINVLLKKFIVNQFDEKNCVACTVWKSNIKCDHTKKIREINSLVIALVKTLI